MAKKPAAKKQSVRKTKHGKKYMEKSKLVDKSRAYPLIDAIALVKQTHFASFDASVELHVKLGVDHKKADQMVRGTIVLPHGTGKTRKILVIAEGDDAEAARKAGADHVGSQDMIDKIEGGWLDFDLVIATPNLMARIARLGKILGTKGLMPSPKAGTVTTDVARTVKEWKLGKVEYKLEKLPLIHTICGKVSFSEAQLLENVKALMAAIIKAKPATSKGVYLQSAFITTTMGPSIKLDLQELREIK
ncbi:MAG TPA: 50S ribosomal protein L1 [bacterium]|nr:50S ribosomal protein L1 [bacterium]